MPSLTLEEQELHISMSADKPGVWYVYADWPKAQRDLEKAGARLVKTEPDGVGRHYELDARQVLIRRIPKRRALSDEQKAVLVARGRKALAATRTNNTTVGEIESLAS